MFHLVLFPIFALNFVYAVVRFIRLPGIDRGWGVIVSAALVGLTLITRVYALKVQDRLIRLEEQDRLRRLLPADLRPRIAELSEDQLIAMRFCADDEVERLTRTVLDEKLRGRKEIKGRITNWRADHFRV